MEATLNKENDDKLRICAIIKSAKVEPVYDDYSRKLLSRTTLVDCEEAVFFSSKSEFEKWFEGNKSAVIDVYFLNGPVNVRKRYSYEGMEVDQ